MRPRDPRVDAYIARSAEFARPILNEIRVRVHAACPDVEEKIKWSAPHFDYKGPMCAMAAFKQHCTFGFWKAALVIGDAAPQDAGAMGHFGRITRVADLPPRKIFREYIRKAMAVNESGATVPRAAKAPRPLSIPGYFMSAVGKNRKALATFEQFSPSHRREYVEWVTEAKTEATRERRLEQTVAWLAEGKPRNWKYMRP